jgi:hypothetical protein
VGALAGHRWLIAFPALTVIRPLVTRMVDRLTG